MLYIIHICVHVVLLSSAKECASYLGDLFFSFFEIAPLR